MMDMPKQAVWYVGFILGAVATSLVLGLFGIEDGILRLLLVIAGGVGFGFLSDTIAKREES
jgi:hypothetical protein